MIFQSTSHLFFTLIFAQLLELSIQDSECLNLKQEIIDCPSRSDSIENHILRVIQECKDLKKGNTQGETIGCQFFPNFEGEDCDYGLPDKILPDTTTNCTHGYIVRATRQKRGSAGYVFISVKFFGLIQPVPNLMSVEEALAFLAEKPIENSQHPNCFDDTRDATLPEPNENAERFDVTEWLSLGISPTDDQMGSDLILYCHPFMDRQAKNCGHNFTEISDYERFYPDRLGVGITMGLGFKQAYDADRKYGENRGKIQAEKVKYVPSATNASWGFLECSAEISTFILLQSRAELTKGIQIDMEKQTQAFILLATGGCLVRDCLGDVKENELADVARRTTVMAKHRKIYVSKEQEVLYDLGEKGGAGPIVALSYATMIFYNLMGWAFLQ